MFKEYDINSQNPLTSTQIPETHVEKEENFEKIRDQIFDSILIENIISSYEKDLLNAGFNQEQILNFFSIINNLNEEEQRKILAFAFEQRQVMFKNYLDDINKKKTTIQEFVNELLDIGNEYSYDIGFHVTNQKIEKKTNKDGKLCWDIKGLEKDHRDNDLTMAFYSKQYRHLYGNKKYKYIYIIRSLPDHRTDGNWFRAPALSIISELQIDPFVLVEKIQSELEKRKEVAH